MCAINSPQPKSVATSAPSASEDFDKRLADVQRSLFDLTTALTRTQEKDAALKEKDMTINELDRANRALKMERALRRSELAEFTNKAKDAAALIEQYKFDFEQAETTANNVNAANKELRARLAELDIYKQKSEAAIFRHKVEKDDLNSTTIKLRKEVEAFTRNTSDIMALRKEKEALAKQAAEASSKALQATQTLRKFGDERLRLIKRVEALEAENTRLKKIATDYASEIAEKNETITALETLAEDMAARIAELEEVEVE